MKTLYLSVCLLVAFVATAADHTFTSTPHFATTNYSGNTWLIDATGAASQWRNYEVSYFPVLEYYVAFSTSDPSNAVKTLNVPLFGTVTGDCQVVAAVYCNNTGLIKAAATNADFALAPIEYTGYKWTKLGDVTAAGATNIILAVHKTTGLGTNQNYWFAGMGLLSREYATFSSSEQSMWAKYVPTTLETNDISSGNLMPNSSFEFGVNDGWTSGRNGDFGEEIWLSNMVTNGVGYHGNRCAAILASGPNVFRYQIQSPSLWIRSDSDKQRQYTLSWYDRDGGGTYYDIRMGMHYAGADGYITNAIMTNRYTPATGSWTRRQTNLFLTPQPNALFHFTIFRSAPAPMLFDAFQLEETPVTGVASDYAPMDPVEVALATGRNGSIFDTNEARNVTVQFYNNTASSSNVSFRYVVYDWMSRIAAQGTNTYTAEPGYSTETLTLTATNNGTSRMYGWLEGATSGKRAELVFSVCPLPDAPILETNSIFGSHALNDWPLLESNKLWGISWQGGLSPGGITEWSEIEPSNDNWTWTTPDNEVNRAYTNSIIVANITSLADIPSWALVRSFDYTSESGGPFQLNEQLSWASGQSVQLAVIWDRGTTGVMFVSNLVGTASWPTNGHTLTGLTSLATCTISSIFDGEATTPPTYDIESPPHPVHFSNYVYTTVNRYKDRIRYWEDFNEPSADWSPMAHAVLLSNFVAAVRAADPTAYILAFGGVAEKTTSGWPFEVWDLLDTWTKNNIDAVAVHNYPADTDNTRLWTSKALIDYTGKPAWNTETGVWGWGDHKGERTGGPQGAISYMDHVRENEFKRTVLENTAKAARNWLGSFMVGMSRYLYYDGRVQSYTLWTEELALSVNPTVMNYTDDSLNSVGVALLWSRHFCDLPTSIVVATNNANANICGVGFQRASGNQVVAVWAMPYETNYLATVTNSAFAVYDLHGNLVATNDSTVIINRYPTYWVSGSLTGEQLVATARSAAIAVTTDTVAPAVSIDLSPHGEADNRKLPLRFRWIAVDDLNNNSDNTPLQVLTQYRFPGVTDWSGWSANREAELASMPSETTIEVQAKDASGNESETFYGPAFGTPLTPIHTNETAIRPRGTGGLSLTGSGSGQMQLVGPQTNLYVSPSPEEWQLGTRSFPFGTLQSARGHVSGPKTIHLLAGTHTLTQAMTLTSADDHTIWANEEGASVAGSLPITGWTLHSGSIYKADVSTQGLAGLNFRQLYWNGQRQVLARTPNAHPTNLYNQGDWFFADTDTPNSTTVLYYKAANELTLADPTNAWINFYPTYGYWNNRSRITAVDTGADTYTVSGASFTIGPGDRYFVYGDSNLLDTAGEWWLDVTNSLLYFWPPTNSPTLAEVPAYAPVATNLFAGSGVSDLRWSGLTLWGTVGSAVNLTNSTNCAIEGNTLTLLGDYTYNGLTLLGGQSNRVSGNDFRYIGYHGAYVTGGVFSTLEAGANVVENNLFEHCGMDYVSGAGVSLVGIGNTASNNLVRAMPRFGIQFKGQNLDISYNVVTNVMRETDDGAAIYTYGPDWLTGRGCTVRYNLVGDAQSWGWDQATDARIDPSYAFGIYWDGYSQGGDTVGNVVYGTTRAGVFLNDGSQHVVSNNIVGPTDSELGQIQINGRLDTESNWTGLTNTFQTNWEVVTNLPAWSAFRGLNKGPTEHVTYTAISNTVALNVVVSSNAPYALNARYITSPWNTYASNIYTLGATAFAVASNAVSVDWATWTGRGLDTGSVEDDALVNADWTLAIGSPALAMGFQQLPVTQMGVYSNASRVSWPMLPLEVWEPPVETSYLAETFDPQPGYDTVGWTASSSEVDPDATTSPAPLAGTQSAFFEVTVARTLDTPEHAPLGEQWEAFMLHLDEASLPGALSEFYFVMDTNPLPVLKLTLHTDGDITVTHGTESVRSTDSITYGTTYYFWVHYAKGTGTDGVGELYWSTTTTPGAAKVQLTSGTSTNESTHSRYTGQANLKYVLDEVHITDVRHAF